MRHLILFLFFFVATHVVAQQWSIEYVPEEHENISLITGDNSGTYDYVVGMYHDKSQDERCPMAICIDKDGAYRDKIFEFEGKKSRFNLALGLGDGNVFVVAPYSDSVDTEYYEKLWIAVLNPYLEVVFENMIELDDPYTSYIGMSYALENESDEIVVVTRVTDSIPLHTEILCDFSFLKFDDQCNLIQHSYTENKGRKSEITDFVLVPNKGEYALFGNGMHLSGMSNINYFDDDFNHLSTVFFDDMSSYPDLLLPLRMSVDYWYDESHFLMSAQNINTSGVNEWKPFVAKVDTDMNVLKTLDLERVDTTDYVFQNKNMSFVDKDKIYIATFWEIGSFLDAFPNSLTVYLVNDDLDLLGRKTIPFEEFYFGLHTHSTMDGGCLLVGKFGFEGNESILILKVDSDEFEMHTDVVEYENGMEMLSYPNPVSSSLNIIVKEEKGCEARVFVVDMFGRRYLDKAVFLDGEVLSIDVSPLEEGMYVCGVIVNDKCVYKDKFVKEKN